MAANRAKELLYSRDVGLRIIELNRPKVLNALNLSMIRELTPRLERLEHEPTAQMIMLKGTGGKAFCAGGDIRSLYEHAKCNINRPVTYDFFREEYRLNYLLSQMKKPVIAVVDGVVMGGGVGISLHGLQTSNRLGIRELHSGEVCNHLHRKLV